MILDRLYYNLHLQSNANVMVEEIDYTQFDTKTLKKVLSNYNGFSESFSIYDKNAISLFLYDVNESIKKCEFTDVQLRRLSMWFNGYNESDIAKVDGVSRWVVSKSIHAACEKILSILIG